MLCTACGNSDDQGTQSAPSPSSVVQSQPESPPAKAKQPRKQLNRWLELSATGDVQLEEKRENLVMEGGCNGKTPMSMGHRQGAPGDDDYFYLSINTADIVGMAQTGDFELKSVTWDNGSRLVDERFNMPVRFEGSGSLELTSHVARSGERLMEGTIRATVVNESDAQTAELEARFATEWSCGVEF